MKRMGMLWLLVFPVLIWTRESSAGFIVAVGKNASSDNSVMVGCNQESKPPHFVNVWKSNRPSFTSSKFQPFLSIQIVDSEFSDSYFNERGVTVVSIASPSREDRSEISGNSVGPQLSRWIAEQAKTAREGISIAAEAIQLYGFNASARTFAVADNQEVWILHVIRGKHWIAQRVPDDHIAVIGDTFTIGEADIRDGRQTLASADIIDYAAKRGWYHPEKETPFHFSRAYSPLQNHLSDGSRLRQWRGMSLLADKSFSRDAPLPFSLPPKRKIRVQDLFRVLRDQFEGTGLDADKQKREKLPLHLESRAICSPTVRYSCVIQLRNEIADEIAHLVWLAFGRPDTTAYIPWHIALNTPPHHYSRQEDEGETGEWAYESYSKLTELVDRQYRQRIEKVQKVWRNFENSIFKDQHDREGEYIYILKNNRTIALRLLTNYIHFLEYRKWLLTSDLIREFRK